MNSILILGAADLQLPLIKYVKSLGYRVVVVSIPGPYPGFEIADRAIYRDVRDAEGILKDIVDEEVVSVLTDETDITVPTVAFLCDKLGLKGNPINVAQTYSNKFSMRELCKKIGVSVPLFFHASNEEEVRNNIANFSFPAIMKPEDNQGSRGIFLVHSLDEILYHFDNSLSYSKTGNVIIETFFEGREVVCEGFTIDGEYVNWGMADRKYFNLDGLFIPCQTIFPATISKEMQDIIISADKKIHNALKPSFGMVHSEYLVNESTGEYILVETALRGGGVYISSHLVPFYTQYDNYKLLVECSLGEKYNIQDIENRLSKRASAYMCFYLPEGVITSIEGIDELNKLNCVVHHDLVNLNVGTITKKMVNKTQRLGPIIVVGNNRQEIDDNIKKVQETLSIKVQQTNGKTGEILWT